MKVVLVGQPNTGKSTIFNHIAGFKAVVGNFPGVTVEGEMSIVKIDDKEIELWDIPGLYSLLPSDKAEEEAIKILSSSDVDIIVNVIDASAFIRNFELTLELFPLQKPMVIALTMTDIAEKKGIKIDIKKMEEKINIPVVIVNGRTGEGIKDLFKIVAENKAKVPECKVPHYIKEAIDRIMSLSSDITLFIAVQSLRGDFSLLPEEFRKEVEKIYEDSLKKERFNVHDILAPYRHHFSMSLFEEISTIEKVKKKRFSADTLLMHPVWGYVFMIIILIGMYYIVMKIGKPIEDIFVNLQSIIESRFIETTMSNSVWGFVLKGVVEGVLGGFMVVFPYLFPFLFILSIFEDIGYLPRVAYLMDGLMHKIGLHGRSIIPLILGYGCSVPAVMASRTLPNRKERILTVSLAVMIPCSARTTIIMGFASYILGVWAGFSILALNLVIIGIVGRLLSMFIKDDSMGLVMEIPEYRMFSLKIVLMKTWIRIKEFFYIVIPVLVLGSVLLGIIDFYNYYNFFDNIFRWITFILGLPARAGTLLMFGLLKKEMSLIMLFQQFGDIDNIIDVFGKSGVFVFTVFSVFYIPCLATIAAIWKELGWKNALWISLFTLFVGLIVGGFFNFVLSVFHQNKMLPK